MKVSTVMMGMPASLAFLQRCDHGILVDRRQEEEVQVAAGDHGVEHGRLVGDVPVLGDLDDQFNTQVSRGLLRAALHGEVERVLYARQEADLVALLGRRLSTGRRLAAGLGCGRRLGCGRCLGCCRCLGGGRRCAATGAVGRRPARTPSTPSPARARYCTVERSGWIAWDSPVNEPRIGNHIA